MPPTDYKLYYVEHKEVISERSRINYLENKQKYLEHQKSRYYNKREAIIKMKKIEFYACRDRMRYANIWEYHFWVRPLMVRRNRERHAISGMVSFFLF